MTDVISRRQLLLSCIAGGLSASKLSHGLVAQDTNDDARRLVTPEIRQTIERSLQSLTSMQHQDGSFGSGTVESHSIGVTALVGLAYLAGGHTPGNGPYGETVERITDFLVKNCDANRFHSKVKFSHSRPHVRTWICGYLSGRDLRHDRTKKPEKLSRPFDQADSIFPK